MMHRTQTISDSLLRAMSHDNMARARRVREEMGARYLCHPANHVQRLKAPPSILTVQRQISSFGKQDGNEKETHPYPSKGG